MLCILCTGGAASEGDERIVVAHVVCKSVMMVQLVNSSFYKVNRILMPLPSGEPELDTSFTDYTCYSLPA
jgi:hypothetical protein